MDGQTERQMERQTNEWADKRIEKQIGRLSNGWRDEQKDGQTDRMIDRLKGVGEGRRGENWLHNIS